MQILHKENLPLGGFAGLREHRFVADSRVGGQNDTWNGLGHFVYLADAYFNPFGETRMHSHREIDVISVMIDGEIQHEGSLEHGASLIKGDIQVQRAGGEGFRHNEVNPHAKKNRMLQLWVLPESAGEKADYKHYALKQDNFTQIYGGSKNQDLTFDSHTIIEVGRFSKEKSISRNGDFLAYITQGNALVNHKKVKDGDLIRGINLDFQATSDNTQLILITEKI